MIFVNRDRIPKPDFFTSKGYKQAQNNLKSFYDVPLEERRQRRYTDKSMPRELRASLHELFGNKCAYCETKVDFNRDRFEWNNPVSKSGYSNMSDENFSIINHFRPRNNAKGFGKEDASVDHYWWLTFEWYNLYLSCFKCNRNKANWFPVGGERVEVREGYKSFKKYYYLHRTERPQLLDPCFDYPDEHIDYDLKSGMLHGKTRKGNTTIEILNLNRRDLVNSRRNAIQEEIQFYESNRLGNKSNKGLGGLLPGLYNGQIDESNRWQQIITGTSPLDFLGIRRAIIKQILRDNPNEVTEKYGEGDHTYFQHILRPEGFRPTDILDFERTSQKDVGSDEIAQESVSDIDHILPDGGADLSDEVIDDLFEDFPNTDPEDFIEPELEPEQPEEVSEDEAIEIRALLKNVHIDKIELKNYKCFENLEVQVPDIPIQLEIEGDIPKEHWLVFLGENGVGKSSLIKAVAIALMGQEYLDRLKLDPKRVLKRGKRKGHIKVYGTKEDEIYEVHFTSKSITSSITKPACYLLGYGSTRLLPKGGLQPEPDTDYVKSKNLFDYSIALSDAKKWLLNLPKDEFDNVATSLKDLLLLDNDVDIVQNKKEKSLVIDDAGSNNETDIEELSDGYKSIVALTVDIIKTLSLGNLTFKDAEAVVLLDEIGTHLHPRWKMEVVKRLRETFPRIQFIVTTHEPLCLKGLVKNEVVVLKKDEDQKIISVTDLPSPSDFRVDQLLTSEYFGLNSTIDIETEMKFKEYYELLAKEERTSEEDNRISELASALPNKIGNDIRDELAYYAIDELLAKRIKNNKKGFKLLDDGIKQEAVDRVKEIWDFIDSNDKN